MSLGYKDKFCTVNLDDKEMFELTVNGYLKNDYELIYCQAIWATEEACDPGRGHITYVAMLMKKD